MNEMNDRRHSLNRIQVLTLVLCGILLGLNLWQGRQISRLEDRARELQGTLSNQVDSLRGEVGALSHRLAEGEKLVQEWTLEPAGIDRETEYLSAEAAVTLKEWREDTEVRVTVRQGADSGTILLESQGTGRFSGRLRVPLTAGAALRLEAWIDSDGISRREELGTWDNVSMLLPLQNCGDRYSGPVYQNGVFSLYAYTLYLMDQNGELAEAEEPVFSLECGGKILWQGPGTVTGGRGYSIGGTGEVREDAVSGGEDASGYSADGAMEVPCEVGDQVELFFTCRDRYGLRYTFPLESWEIDAEGKLPVTAPGNWPILSWD